MFVSRRRRRFALLARHANHLLFWLHEWRNASALLFVGCATVTSLAATYGVTVILVFLSGKSAIPLSAASYSVSYLMRAVLLAPLLENGLLYVFGRLSLITWGAATALGVFIAALLPALVFASGHVFLRGVIGWATLPSAMLISLVLVTAINHGQDRAGFMSALSIHSLHNLLVIIVLRSA